MGKEKNSKVPLISEYYWDFDSKKPDRHLGYLWWKPRKTITSNTISGEVWITAPDFDLFAVQFDHRTVWCPHQFDLKRIIYQRVQTKSLLIREKSRSCKIGFWMLSEVSKSLTLHIVKFWSRRIEVVLLFLTGCPASPLERIIASYSFLHGTIEGTTLDCIIWSLVDTH